MKNKQLHFDQLLQYFREKNPLLYYSAATVAEMKGDSVYGLANQILPFLLERYKNPYEIYIERVEQLIKMQRRFEKTGEYQSNKYSDVSNIDRDIYNIALLMSFVTTVHRFEIYEKLAEFIEKDSTDSGNCLSVGVGTGYEIKMLKDICPHWRIDAYDNSKETVDYARSLLRYYGYEDDSIRSEEYPLEVENEGVPVTRYDKIIICELLEHLEKPEQALINLGRALKKDGLMFVTTAVNIAQEDHIYLYSSIEDSRNQLTQAGLEIVSELISPVVATPYEEKDRISIFQKGNYIAVVRNGQ